MTEPGWSSNAVNDRRTRWAGFRATDDEAAAIALRAAQARLKVSPFIRLAALRAEIVVQTIFLDTPLRNDVARVVNLLKQIDDVLGGGSARHDPARAPLLAELDTLLADSRAVLAIAYDLQHRTAAAAPGLSRTAERLRRRPTKGFRATPGEEAAIAQQAARARLTPSQFMRAASLGEPIVVLEAAVDPALRQTLNRVGWSLNPIARHLNATGDSRRLDDLPFLLAALRPIIDTLLVDGRAARAAIR